MLVNYELKDIVISFLIKTVWNHKIKKINLLINTCKP